MTVSGTRESQLVDCSFIPAAKPVLGTDVGTPQGGFYTWSINPLPVSVVNIPGDPKFIGAWSSEPKNILIRQIGMGANGTTETRMLTDMPVCISNVSVKSIVRCETMWKLHKLYRITFVSCTFTVPEFTEGKRNHNLYLEWTHLPRGRCSAYEDCNGMVVGSAASSMNTYGFNWIVNPPDIAEACCPDGRNNRLNGWHRRQLAYNRPVTISWRPRHTNLLEDHQNYLDSVGSSGQGSMRVLDHFGTKNKLIRGYLPTDVDQSIFDERQFWMGPCIRLVDADMPISDQGGGINNKSLFDVYGVRVSTLVKVKFKDMNTTDPLFPEYVP